MFGVLHNNLSGIKVNFKQNVHKRIIFVVGVYEPGILLPHVHTHARAKDNRFCEYIENAV